MAEKMRYAGPLNSEDTYAGQLANGKTICVQIAAIATAKYEEGATEEQIQDPEYWFKRFEQGDFVDPNNAPVVWIEELS